MTLPRVFVVDDEPGMLHAVVRVLEPLCQITACENAEETLERAAEAAPDLVFLDVRLPDLDGFDLMQRLQATCPGADVVLMTGSLHDMDRKLVRSLRERAFFFLSKPFGRELLLTVFDRWREMRDLAMRDRAHRTRLEHDLREAQAFQLGLIPPARASFGEVTLHGHFEPCDEVSGDLYDYAATDDGRVALMVCDVSGHGVAAAMLSGLLKTAFQSSHAEGFDPLAVVGRVRDALVQTQSERFVTLMAARLGDGQLEYVNAGHQEALLHTGDGAVQRLGPTGPLVSNAFAHAQWGEAVVAAGPGASVLLYTDGVDETRNAAGELFGLAPLEAALTGHPDGDAVLGRILREQRAHAGGRPLQDDLTLLLARIGTGAEG